MIGLVLFLLLNSEVLSLNSSAAWSLDPYEQFCGYNETQFSTYVTCNYTNEYVTVNQPFCLTFIDNTTDQFFFGKCPILNLNIHTSVKLSSSIITNVSTFNEDIMCAQNNRTGVLCGKCNSSFGISLNTIFFECISDEHCHSYNWLYFIMAHIVPVTVLFLFVIFFDIKLTSGYANSYILFSQVISSQIISRSATNGLINSKLSLKVFNKLLVGFYSIWNLDLGQIIGKNLCASKSIDNMDTIALQYISSYYSFLLIIIAYCSISLISNKDFVLLRACKWSICTTLIHSRLFQKSSTILINAFAIFYLLSCSKLLAVSLMLLCPTYLYSARTGSSYKAVYLYDGTVNYFQGTKVILLNIFAIFTLIVFIIIPPFLLLFYPMRQFRRVLQYLNLNRPGLVTFVNSFQECYKDGTNGTRDYRWFSAVYFLLRIMLMTIYFFFGGIYDYKIAVMILDQVLIMFALVLVAFLLPYRQRFYNHLDVSILLFGVFIFSLAIANTFFLGTNKPASQIIEVLLMISFIIPFVCAVLYISYYTVLKLIVCTRLSYKAWYTMRQVHNTSDIDSFVQDKATVSHTFTTDRNDLTPSLPDRLVHPFSYSEHDNFISVNYGSTDQKR